MNSNTILHALLRTKQCRVLSLLAKYILNIFNNNKRTGWPLTMLCRQLKIM